MKLARQQYRKVKLAEVKPHPRNPRKGSLEAIAESLEANDFYGAIVVQKGTGYVLAGNHRLLAAKEQGAKELPAMVVDCDDETALRILLADNATSDKAEYDTPELHALLKEIGQEAGTLEGTGWGFDDFRALEREVAKLTNGDAGADEVPEPPAEPRSKPGEIYELGPHRLMCGDATDPEVIEALMAGEEADLLLTDPPYGVEYQVKMTVAEARKRHRRTDLREVTNDDLGQDVAPIVEAALRNACVVLKPGGVFYLFSPSGDMETAFRLILEAVGLPMHQEIVWVKDRFVLGRSDYHWRHETILYGWKTGAGHFFTPERTEDTVWECARPARSEEHPTIKPVELVARAIQNSSYPGEIVLDPFAGSGTCLLAAEQLSRRCFALEIDPRYCDVIRDRYEAFVAARSVAA